MEDLGTPERTNAVPQEINLTRRAKWTVLQFSALAAAIGVTLLATLNSLGATLDCLQRKDAGAELPDVKLYSRDYQPVYTNHELALYYEHDTVSCSCNRSNGLQDIKLQRGENDTWYIGYPGLVVNMSKTETCGAKDSGCFMVAPFTNFEHIHGWVEDGLQKIEGFAVLRRLFFEPARKATVLNASNVIRDTRARYKLRPFTVQLIPGTISKEAKVIVPTEAVLDSLEEFQQLIDKEYGADKEALEEKFEESTRTCRFDQVWVYLVIAILVISTIQVAWVAWICFVVFIRNKKKGLLIELDQKTHSRLFLLDGLNNLIGICFFAGLLYTTHSTRSVLTITVLVANVVFDIGLSLYSPKFEEIQEEAIPMKIKRKIRVAVVRYSLAALTLGMTFLTVLISIGVLTKCFDALHQGPALVDEDDFDRDLMATVLSQPRGGDFIVVEHPRQGCSCEYGMKLTQAADGSDTWYLVNETLVANYYKIEFCEYNNETGCFMLDYHMDNSQVIPFFIGGKNQIDFFSGFEKKVVRPAEQMSVEDSIPFLSDVIASNTMNEWQLRREPMYLPGYYRYYYARRDKSLSLLLEHQVSVSASMSALAAQYEEDFQKDTTTCKEGAFRSLTITTLTLSVVQILWNLQVFVKMIRSEKLVSMSGLLHISLMGFDGLIDVLYIIFFTASLNQGIELEVVLSLVVLCSNVIYDVVFITSMLWIWRYHSNEDTPDVAIQKSGEETTSRRPLGDGGDQAAPISMIVT